MYLEMLHMLWINGNNVTIKLTNEKIQKFIVKNKFAYECENNSVFV